MKKYSHSFMIARFQPLHNGHKTIIDKMLSESNYVTIILGSAQESGTKTNPLSPEQRQKLIENLYGLKKNMKILFMNDIECDEDTWYKHVINFLKENTKEFGFPEAYYCGDMKNGSYYDKGEFKIINVERENQKGFNYEQNKLFDSEDLYMDKNSHLNIASSKINEQKEINCCTNERFPIFGNIELKNKQEIKNIQKNENKKEKENKTLSLLISNQNNFIIKNDEKKICYKTTETEKKINLMNPNKSSELLFKGIKTSNKNKKGQVFKKENNSIEIKCVQNKKDKIFKKENNFIEIKSVPNKKKKIFKKENNFIEIKGNKIANEQILKTENNSIELNPDNNKKEQILKTENNFIELKKVPKSQILTKENNYIEFKPEKINKKIITNYNLTNEIEKGDALEINPYEIKRTKDPNKISQQDNLQVLSFTEKSKLNLAKTIFLIKFKKILVEYIKKKYFPDFQNELKKIALMHALNKIKKNYEKKTKKIGLKNLKEIAMIIKIKKYFKVEMEKYEMKKLIKKYLVKKWYNGLLDLSKIIINNKK